VRLTSAARARRGVHRTRLAVTEATAVSATLATTGLLSCGTALRATARRVGQTTAGIKFLLTRGKGEFLIAVATIQNLIGQRVTRFLLCCMLQQTSVFPVLRTITFINFLVETPEFIFSSNICT
jgi:selenophosphate synthase